MFGRTKSNFWLDIFIFITFLITTIIGLLLWLAMPDGPGSRHLIFLGLARYSWIEIHKWAGLAMIGGVAIHLALHWNWVGCVIERFFKKLPQKTRLNFLLDSALSASFFLVGLSGLEIWLMLSGGGYQGGRSRLFNATLLALNHHNWKDIHFWAALAMISVLSIHLALHWRWIMCMARRHIQPKGYLPAT